MEDSRTDLKLTITGPADRLTGFRYFWLKYVSDFKSDVHCARCLIGPYSTAVSNDMLTRRTIALNEVSGWDYLYLCGVSPKWPTNFHLAMKPGNDIIKMKTYNGFEVVVTGAERMDIPSLPDGWNGLSKAFTTCRNYQFGVRYYG